MPSLAQTVLITGSEGFVGSHLAEHIASSFPEIDLHGTFYPNSSLEYLQSVQHIITTHELDITKSDPVFELISRLKPIAIFHLAAQSYVKTSWESPQATLFTNIVGQTNILEALRMLKTSTYNPTCIIAGSSEMYGHTNGDDTPLDENTPFNPLSPYAVSKIGQDLLGLQYFNTYNLRIIRLRIFNHTGPRRPTTFGDSAVAYKIAMIEKNKEEPVIMHRDLSAIRDFTDVRDIVRAYTDAWKYCVPGEAYNVCSGTGISIQQIYDTLVSASKRSRITLIPDPQGARPSDGGVIIGNNAKFTNQTKWKPKISFTEQTLPDLLEYWRNHA